MIDKLTDISIVLSGAMLLLPLASFLLYLLVRNERIVIGASVAAIALSMILAVTLLVTGANQVAYTNWLVISPKLVIPIGIKIDALSGVIALVVTLVSLIVHLFSISYMAGDAGRRRYFGLLGLFTFAMLGIVLSPNLVMLFVFWELVGFSSYLLIGFWFEKPSASKAAFKAFVVNRIGDMGFLMAIAFTWAWFGTTDIDHLNAVLSTMKWSEGTLQSGDYLLTTAHLSLIGLGIFMGVVGKSAQFPLLVWLPDAMEGPTPVSALIHAATMVAAGVFLLAKTFVMLSPIVLLVITIVGILTALLGAVAALQQFDIKRVLAFSTISQLGYMVVGIGVGAWFPAVLHLVTHAFFKAALFLSAGSVIHGLHHAAPHGHSFDAQDMRSMGGLRKAMPVTYWCYTAAMLSLVGLPLFSGFLSKDAILVSAWQWAGLQSGSDISLYHLVPLLALVGVALTAYYMGRQTFMVFFGESRIPKGVAPRETPMQYIPLAVLAVLSLFVFFSFNPFDANASWLREYLVNARLLRAATILPPLGSSVVPLAIALGSTLLALGGLLISKRHFHQKTDFGTAPQSSMAKLSANNFYLDKYYELIFVRPYMHISKIVAEIDRVVVDAFVNFAGVAVVVFANIVHFLDGFIVDGVVNFTAMLSGWVGKFTKGFQGGNIQSYFLWAMLGFVLIMVWFFQMIEWKITF